MNLIFFKNPRMWKSTTCLYVFLLFFCTTMVFAQQSISVTGTVTESGQPLPGVTVLVKGTNTGTVTDVNGKFQITVPNADAVLQFSFVGFSTTEVTVGNQRDISVSMTEDAFQLDEVVITALGIKRSEKALSYNVQKVDSESVNAVKDANFITALSGKVAGLEIKSVAGGVGASTRVTMRGIRSISQNNNVLYVIDGVPTFNYSKGNLQDEYAGEVGSESIADINPDDIIPVF